MFFEDFIKPIYGSLEDIHQDYIKTISEVERKLQSGDEALFEEGIDLMKVRQAEMRALKDQFKSLVAVYEKEKDRKFPKTASLFYERCLDYFKISDSVSDEGKAKDKRNYDSWYAYLLGDDVANDMAKRAEIYDHVEFIATIKKNISDRWREVTSAYGKARIDLLR